MTRSKQKKEPDMKPQAKADSRQKKAPLATTSLRSSEALLHELQVHQVELEAQNEALRQSQNALEESRDRYVDLYEFAPVGYLTLTATDLISEVNLTGAALLGRDRSRLISRRFAELVTVADRDRWYRLFLLASQGPETCADELLLQREDGSAFPALIECRLAAGNGAAREMLLTLTDIGERKRIEQALSRSEESFRRLAQISPAAIFRADVKGACTYANQRCAEITGRRVEDLLGDGWRKVMHVDDRDRTLAKWRQDMSVRQPKPLAWRVVRPDGSVRRVLSEAAAEMDERGKVLGYISSISDITELWQREEQRRAELAAQRDTLIREVHHRIKNNLQSVAGLLQRELGKFMELNPRLEAAISQINAIALVHGLQCANADEAIRLCDSVRNICKTVSDLSQRPVLFNIECEDTSFKPVRIESTEAVSVALVLNELILNAVKHSPEGHAAPTVSLSADGNSARLVIRNALSGVPEFNIDTGQGLGTGLRLVRSLLPNKGTHLVYALTPENCLIATLTLTAPVSMQILQHDPV